MDIKEKIIKFLKESDEPRTSSEIAEALSIKTGLIRKNLKQLFEEEKIYKIKGPYNIYYMFEREVITENLTSVHDEVLEEIVKVKDNCRKLADDIEQIRENVNNIYINIISIISIFVAIFTLITVNANIVIEITKENMANIFWGIILINIFVVACIIALLLVTRFVIIKPIIKGKKE